MTALIVMLMLNGIGDLGTAGDGLLSHGATDILGSFQPFPKKVFHSFSCEKSVLHSFQDNRNLTV